jgi:hypothetical protein
MGRTDISFAADAITIASTQLGREVFPIPEGDAPAPAPAPEQNGVIELPVDKPQSSAPTTAPQPSNTSSSAPAVDPYSGPYIWKYK